MVSDGSTDGTDRVLTRLAQQDPRVAFFRQEPRAGKTAALNSLLERARGEIIVFADANSMYRPDTVRQLVAPFADPGVGYASGRMLYVDPQGSLVGDGCTAYMRYENALRTLESAVGSVVGVDGGVDAIRRSLYRPMRPDQLPDFVLPLAVVEQGRRVVYAPQAVLQEATLTSEGAEYRMRVRVALRALWALWDKRVLLNPALSALQLAARLPQAAALPEFPAADRRGADELAAAVTRLDLRRLGGRPVLRGIAGGSRTARAAAAARVFPGALLLLLPAPQLGFRRRAAAFPARREAGVVAATDRLDPIMSLMSSLSRHVFHPLWDLKDGSRRLRILRELERSQWLPLETLKARQNERLRQMLRYAATHSAYYERIFKGAALRSRAFPAAGVPATPPPHQSEYSRLDG